MEWNILGHEWAADLLALHIARQEVRHAYLFCGPPGVGRRSLALRFAQALNCEQPPAPGQPCGACRACIQTAAQQLPDLSVIQGLDEEGQPRPGAAIKIEQIRDLQHNLSLSPFQARWRVALLLNLQTATPAAQNSLLKTLEEAPEKAILLLTADSAEAVLPTISSRCEVLRLRPLGVDALAQALNKRWGLPAGEALRLAHLAGGRPGYALRLHENPAELERIQERLEDLLRLVASSRRARFKYAEQFKGVKNRDTLRLVLSTWMSFWRDLLLAASGAEAPFTHLDQAENIRRLASQLGLPAVRARLADLETALERLDGNANLQLLTEVLLLDWPILR